MRGSPQRFFAFLLTILLAQTTHAATIIITDLEDVDFGDLPPTSSTIAQRIRACVNSTPAGPYRLLAQGFTTDGSFHLTNGAGEALPYDVFASRRRNRLGRPLQAGIPRGGFSARSPNPNGRCRPPRVWITVVVQEEMLQQAPGGAYSGTLQITVAPE